MNGESGAKDCEIDGFQLVLTSFAYPEQYNVFKNGVLVGYLRVRNHIFRADYPDHRAIGGRTIYEAHLTGEVTEGGFENDKRDYYLRKAIQAIKRKLETKL